MSTIPVELRDLLERVADHLEWDGSEPMTTIQYAYKCDGLAEELRALLSEQPQADHSAQDLDMVEQPQAGAGQADEVRQNSERWKYFGGRLAAKLGTTLELMNADIDAALTQSPKGEEE